MPHPPAAKMRRAKATRYDFERRDRLAELEQQEQEEKIPPPKPKDQLSETIAQALSGNAELYATNWVFEWLWRKNAAGDTIKMTVDRWYPGINVAVDMENEDEEDVKIKRQLFSERNIRYGHLAIGMTWDAFIQEIRDQS